MTALPVTAPVPGRRSRPGRAWIVGGAVIAALALAPLAAVAVIAAGDSGDIWGHLATTVLPGYVWTTVQLMALVAVGTLVIGTGTAWLVAVCRFPGRRILEWALLLPLAVPAYVIAYVYTDLLEYAGPVQTALRDLFGWRTSRDYWFPEIRSLGGAAAMMTLVLYPYVYLLARTAFREQAGGVLEVARTLGRGPWRAFVTVALPLARPAVAVGVALALMETLNDFGTVSYFAVHTLTAGLYGVWLTMGSTIGAAQIGLVMLSFVAALVMLERRGRQGRRHHAVRPRTAVLPLAGARAWLATAACAAPVVLGFVVPASVLAGYALPRLDQALAGGYGTAALHSLGLAIGAGVLAVTVAVFLAYARRLGRGRALHGLLNATMLGYAIPGAVLAIGVLVPFGALDNAIDGLARDLFGVSTGLLLSGSVAALLYAYVARFLAMAYGAVDAGLGRVRPGLDMAARTLGAGPGRILGRIHLPLLRGSLVTAGLLVFVDTMKELPATLILRPFDFDTLAVQVYQYASDELLAQAAPGALTIVLAGLLPVILLSRTLERRDTP